MRIYLVRHGETLANAEKRYLGRGSSPFTELGLGQNLRALSKLMQIDFDAVYSSPSERCLSMARKAASGKKINVASDTRLSEIDFGYFEGLTWQEARERFPEEFESLCKNAEEFRFPGGESQNELDIRVRDFAEEAVKLPYENVAVFSHGGAVMSLLSHLLELAPGQKWRFKISHGSVTAVEITGGYACLVL